MLTETDGPHVLIDGAPARPWDVSRVEEHLAAIWQCSSADARQQVWQNFRKLVSVLPSANSQNH